MTFTEKYSKLAKKLIKADTAKYTEDFAVQITMNDEDCGGTFYVAYIDGAFAVEPYDYFDNTVNISIMSAALEKLIDKKITVDDAFEKDLLLANGNTNHIVMLFDGFLKKTVKKAPAKKPAAKKAPVKKEEPKAEAKKEAVKKAEPKAEVKKEEVKKAEPKAEAKKEEVKKAEPKAEVKKEAVKKPEAKTKKK